MYIFITKTLNPDFLQTVAEAWNCSDTIYHSRVALSSFHKKLKALKEALRLLNRTHYGDLPNRTKQAYEELCECQNQALLDPGPETFARAAAASEKWNHLARIEEKFYRQKSCVRWLQAGDQNTKYFHRIAQARAARNMIRSLVNAQGVVLTSQSDIKREAVAHFQTFLQTQDPTTVDISVDYFRSLLTYRCSTETASGLVGPVTAHEIVKAVQALPNDIVSGPDGYTKEFFIAAWPVMGREFTAAIQSFFLYGFMTKIINATILALVPKTEDALTMKDYRPISCCNLLYTLQEKMLFLAVE